MFSKEVLYGCYYPASVCYPDRCQLVVYDPLYVHTYISVQSLIRQSASILIVISGAILYSACTGDVLILFDHGDC